MKVMFNDAEHTFNDFEPRLYLIERTFYTRYHEKSPYA